MAVIVAVLCAAFVACGDDVTHVDDVAVGADVGPDAPIEDCTGVVIAAVVGGDCGGTDRCERGTECAQVAGEDQGYCRQLCIPGTCESLCRADEECATLAEAPGTGVCVPRQVGTVQAYEVCTDADACAEPYSCLVRTAESATGVCLPSCVPEDGCIAHNGRAGECRIRVESASGPTSYCAALCPSGSDEECPGEMSCLATESGSTVCAFGSDGD